MKRYSKFIIILFITFILFGFKVVKAEDITIDDVVSYMNDNSIFDDQDYYKLFGTMFNGKDEYDITKISYEVTKEPTNPEEEEPKTFNLRITVGLDDAKAEQPIEKEYTLGITDDNTITFTSTYDNNSLDARIMTFLFDEIIYSVGGARGYNKEYLVEWMNQIDLNRVTLEDDGIDCTFEHVYYTITKDNKDYEYDLTILKNFTININTITKEIPEIIAAEIHEVKASYTDISMKIYVKDHPDDICYVYRREENEKEYKKIGQVRCNDEEFIDKDVEIGKTYHYQASIEGVIMCSQDVEATLEELPLTGAFVSIGSIITLIVLELLIFMAYKKFRKVQRI